MNHKMKLVIALGISTLFIVTTISSAGLLELNSNNRIGTTTPPAEPQTQESTTFDDTTVSEPNPLGPLGPLAHDNDWNYWTNPPHMFSNVTGNVGIGMTSPVAKFQVGNGAVLFNGTTGSTPVSGAGTRLMWIPSKKAFRAGYVDGTQWDNSNLGLFSVAMGYNSKTSGYASTAMGAGTIASGNRSTAMGADTTASGRYATAMGADTIASMEASTAMGRYTKASGNWATAMGRYTNASGRESTAMGSVTNASGAYATSMGRQTTASGAASTAMGVYTIASGNYATAMGYNTTASVDRSTAMGHNTKASGVISTAMGYRTNASGPASTAMGADTIASGDTSTAMGWGTTASGYISTAMGRATKASGDYGIAMGFWTNAFGKYSMAMGHFTNASGGASTTMGNYATASGDTSIAMGTYTTASGNYAIAMGQKTTASGKCSTALGFSTTASGINSTAMGASTKASGQFTTAMGYGTKASGKYSTAMGLNTIASGTGSTAMGNNNAATEMASTAIGSSNLASGVYSTAIGQRMTVSGAGSVGIGLNYHYPNWEVNSNYVMSIMGGKVGINTTNPQEMLHIHGKYLRVDGAADEEAYIGGDGIGGDVQIGSLNSVVTKVSFFNPTSGAYMGGAMDYLILKGGSDIAEPFDVKENDKAQPGMVLSIDTENPGKLKVSEKAYDRCVAGIISGAGDIKPGIIMGQEGSLAYGKYPVALAGRVYCLCDASYGSIHPGDLLTTSSTPGYAMKATDYENAQGAILGKAMTSLETGKGLVLILVSLQ